MTNISYVTGFLTGRQEELALAFKCEFLALVGSFVNGHKRDPLELVVWPHTCKEALRVYLSGEFPLTKIKIKRITEARADELAGAIYIIGDSDATQHYKVEIT